MSPVKSSVAMRWGLPIPMRDGVTLHATLYAPSDRASRVPTILLFTPYVAQTYHEYGRYFASNGFGFLIVDVRGRGNSEGTFAPYACDGDDAHDAIEWAARQPFCDGAISMWGGSYSGFVQWAAASKNAIHLSSIVPVASPYRGLDSPMRNNVFAPYRLQWLHLVAGRTVQDKAFQDQDFWNDQFLQFALSGESFCDLDVFFGQRSPLFQEWLQHQGDLAYWDRFNPSVDDYRRIAMPVLTITGIYDGDQPGALSHYLRHLQTNASAQHSHFLVIGPWDHAGTRQPSPRFGGATFGEAGCIDLKALHLDWYSWTLRGGPRPSFLDAPVSYYVTGAEEWRRAQSLEAVTREERPLYVSAATNPTDVYHSGVLAQVPPAGTSSSHYIYDPTDTSHFETEAAVDPNSLVDQTLIHALRGKHLIFHSAPFPEDIEIAGFFRFIAWLSLDQPDTDFRVSIHDVAPCGETLLLTDDLQRARHRQGLHTEALIESTAPLKYEFASFLFTARLLKAGHRLRLVFGPINSIFSQRHFNSGKPVALQRKEDAASITVQLHHNETYQSALFVPIGACVSKAISTTNVDRLP